MTNLSGVEVAIRTKSTKYEIRGDINEINEVDLQRVSKVLDVISKEGLIKWKEKQPFEWMFKNFDEMADELTNPNKKRLMPQRRQIVMDKFAVDSQFAAFRGTNVHHIAEHLITGCDMPDTVLQDIEDYPEAFSLYRVQLERVIEELGIELIAAELKLLNLSARYAGTADLVANTKDYGRCIIDWKTTKRSDFSPFGVYLEYMLQGVAYAHAEYSVNAQDFTDEGDTTRGILEPFQAPDNILLINVTNTKDKLGNPKPYAVVPIPHEVPHPYRTETVDVWDVLFTTFSSLLNVRETQKLGSAFFNQGFFAKKGEVVDAKL